MKRNIAATRALLRRLARQVVRGSAVTALVAGGFLGAASALDEDAAAGFADDDDTDDNDNGNGELARMRGAVQRATRLVLDTPHSADSERALVVLMAANEALAVASVAEPGDAHVNEMLVTAAVVDDV